MAFEKVKHANESKLIIITQHQGHDVQFSYGPEKVFLHFVQSTGPRMIAVTSQVDLTNVWRTDQLLWLNGQIFNHKSISVSIRQIDSTKTFSSKFRNIIPRLTAFVCGKLD